MKTKILTLLLATAFVFTFKFETQAQNINEQLISCKS